MVNFVMWLLYGAVVGWVGSSLIGQREGVLLNIIVGILGACVAGSILTPYFGLSVTNQDNFSLPAMLVPAGGAVILLVVLHLVRRWGGLLH
ncbi:MAG: GlsB/YeaQ/YmgE family stress response membrane protein [Anaerolineae bacterium]|nr:GlsB/YeaQ/YmgE family stress response membrane protein [Anaerolineae bacterium]